MRVHVVRYAVCSMQASEAVSKQVEQEVKYAGVT